MDVLDKFFTKYSYKFPKGYPDVKDPKDKEMLFNMVNKLVESKSLLNEQQAEYDNRIKDVLNINEIPTCKTPLSLGKNFNLQGEDEEFFEKLYPILPVKKGTNIPSAGAGKGEIATYWAFQYNTNKHSVLDGRGGEDPDLIIDGIGVEMKSYDTKTITLGKFGKDEESINLLNQIFGVMNLFGEIDPSKKMKVNTGNFRADQALEAFILMHELLSNEGLRKLDVTKNLYQRIDFIYDKLDIEDEISPMKGTAKLLRKLLGTKLAKKPRMGKEVGYILNVDDKGKGTFYEISEKTTNNIQDEDILDNGISVRSSEIQMNFPKLYK
tara:strand:+ start:1441 stop:2412 length:972 start_codon:yes stop_codon:yes gene_type:complete